MSYQLYWLAGSPYSWRALLALEIKGLVYEGKLLSGADREHKAPAFLALNPRGKVPVLTDGDTVVCDSLAIMMYVDRKHPTPSLFGENAVETGRVFQVMGELGDFLAPAVTTFVNIVFRGQVRDKAAEAKELAQEILKELDHFDGVLGTRPFLVDDKMRAADVMLLPGVMAVLRAAGKPDALALDLGLDALRERFRHLAAWIARFEALPGYQRTYPPNWR